MIGEALRNLMAADPGTETRHPGLELTRAYRARNRSVHGYGSVDHDVIWVTAQRDVLPMVVVARALLQSGS